MTCLKCGGLMAREPVSDVFEPCVLWRCLLCGLMLDWLTLKNRHASHARGVEMPKFLSEEHRQRWVEAVRRTKAAKKQQAGATQLPALVKPAALVPHVQRTVARGADVLAVIDQTLAMLAQDRAVLERAKEILSRDRYAGAERV